MPGHPNLTNVEDMEWAEHSHEEKFGYRRKSLSGETGGEKLGCSLYEIPPGRRAWPYHYYATNEEAVYVLEGSGLIRVGEDKASISKGNYATLPARADGAHQVINDSDTVSDIFAFRP